MLYKRPILVAYFIIYMRRLLPILQFIVISFVAGYLSRVLQGASIEEWYPSLAKSSLTPPGYVFSIVWGVLYLLMGISAGIVWSLRTLYSWFLTMLFFVQLMLNLAWNFFFFWLQSPIWGLVTLVLLFVCVILYVIGCYTQNKLSAWLNVPYIFWLLFAVFLNAYIVLYN